MSVHSRFLFRPLSKAVGKFFVSALKPSCVKLIDMKTLRGRRTAMFLITCVKNKIIIIAETSDEM